MPRKPYEKQAITNLQRYLRQLSYEDVNTTRPPIDGVFDTVTEQALIDFQNKNGFEPKGVADRETWDALFSAYLQSIALNSPPAPVIIFPRNPDDFSLQMGDSSLYVTILQHMLRELSRDYGTVFNIKLSDEYDEQTAQAVKAFQIINGMDDNGITDLITWNRITSAYNRRAHEYRQ